MSILFNSVLNYLIEVEVYARTRVLMSMPLSIIIFTVLIASPLLLIPIVSNTIALCILGWVLFFCLFCALMAAVGAIGDKKRNER